MVILTLMKSYEERREEQRKYDNDVFYEVWRNGGNPDRIDFDRVQDRYYNGQDVESAASAELQAQRPKPQEPSEEEYYEEMQRQQNTDIKCPVCESKDLKDESGFLVEGVSCKSCGWTDIDGGLDSEC